MGGGRRGIGIVELDESWDGRYMRALYVQFVCSGRGILQF